MKMKENGWTFYSIKLDNYVKTLFFFILKMNTTLYQIYLKFIWPNRQECERKHNT
jgi:hypothetical protein